MLRPSEAGYILQFQQQIHRRNQPETGDALQALHLFWYSAVSDNSLSSLVRLSICAVKNSYCSSRRLKISCILRSPKLCCSDSQYLSLKGRKIMASPLRPRRFNVRQSFSILNLWIEEQLGDSLGTQKSPFRSQKGLMDGGF
jgi:hypothetical protein